MALCNILETKCHLQSWNKISEYRKIEIKLTNSQLEYAFIFYIYKAVY